MVRNERDRDIFVGDKFFFPIRGNACLSACLVMGSGMRIGSAACQKCVHLLEFNNDEQWLRCSRIEEALGEFSLPVIKRKKELAQGLK